jgi:hypothetical protein
MMSLHPSWEIKADERRWAHVTKWKLFAQNFTDGRENLWSGVLELHEILLKYFRFVMPYFLGFKVHFLSTI